MKKRRELDALVNNGKTSKRIKSNSKRGHELLQQSDTESSDVEFSLPAQKSVIRTRGGSVWKCAFCSACVPICIFILVTICLLLAGAIIWMQLSLRKDIDVLRYKVLSVQSGSERAPDQFQALHKKITEMNILVEDNKKNLAPVSKEIKSIYFKLSTLNSTTKRLSQDLAGAPTLKNMPNNFKQITKDVASLGSSVSSFKQEFENFKQESNLKHGEFSSTIDTLQQTVDALSKPTSHDSSSNPQVSLEMESINAEIRSVNSSLNTRVTMISDLMGKQQKMIQDLANSTAILSTKLRNIQSWQSTMANTSVSSVSAVNTTDIVTLVLKALKNSKNETHDNNSSLTLTIDTIIRSYLTPHEKVLNSSVAALNSTMMRLNTVIATQQTSLIALQEKQQQLGAQINELNKKVSSQQFSPLNIENIRSRADLSEKFKQWDTDKNGVVAIGDMVYVNITVDDLKAFDVNGDGFYSIDEMASALGLLNTSTSSLNNTSAQVTKAMTNNTSSHTHISTRSPTTKADILPQQRSTRDITGPPLYKVVIPGINSSTDLKNAFHQWKPFNNGYETDFVTIDDIIDEVGPVLTPLETYFQVYDLDHNFEYTLKELEMAFGFTKPPYSLSLGRKQIPMPRENRKRKRSFKERKRL